MLSLLINMFICRDDLEEALSFCWFSTKSFICVLIEVHPAKPASSLIWLGLVPPRVEVFCWLAIREGIYSGQSKENRHAV